LHNATNELRRQFYTVNTICVYRHFLFKGGRQLPHEPSSPSLCLYVVLSIANLLLLLD